MSAVIAFPTRANLIRAFAAANPDLRPAQIAWELRTKMAHLKPGEVTLALGRGDRRRVKSVAK